MFPLYDARGNRYCVATPGDLRMFDLPQAAACAARSSQEWTRKVVEHVCSPDKFPAFFRRSGRKYVSDGLLVGPFSAGGAFELLIVNTDGTLAERSGNGLSIFSQFLVDSGRIARTDAFSIRILHPWKQAVNVCVVPGNRRGQEGFWIDMGLPAIGPESVNASFAPIGMSQHNGRDVSRVPELERIDAAWTRSVFVGIDNPHCVTFLNGVEELPSMALLASLTTALAAVANDSESGEARGAGRPCRNGVNLQWAASVAPNEVEARVFERGEGPTASSGTSATAVASAARYLRLVTGEIVNVAMPGGVAPVRFDEKNGHIHRVMLFGVAECKSV